MNLKRENWTLEDISEFQTYLLTLVDLEYQKFHQGLFKEAHPILGIRTPELKRIAKEISRGDVDSFLKQLPHQSYEETVIHGLLLGYLKEPFELILNHLDQFIPFVDNWATCDLTCANLKQFQKHRELGINKIKVYLKSNNPWEIRVGLILLLDSYLTVEYINQVLSLADQVTNEHYYVKMGNAWLLSVCYVKFPEKTMQLIKHNHLDDWTHNKAIQKICESLRVSEEDKKNLRKWKRETTRKSA